MTSKGDDIKRPWFPAPEGRLFGRGHPAGDFLQAYDWHVLEHRPGHYRVECQLPLHVRNPRGQLFGGFAPTYVDLIAIRAAHSTLPEGPRGMSTVNMRVDYFDPVVEDRFVLEGRVVHNRGRTFLCEVTFKDLAGRLLIFSIVTLRQRGS